jgi:hypothetical protein
MDFYGPVTPDFSNFYIWNAAIFAVFILVTVWSIIWKGFALYRAGANRSPAWFVVLLIFNTVGILEILYLFVFSKKKTVAPTVYQTPEA